MAVAVLGAEGSHRGQPGVGGDVVERHLAQATGQIAARAQHALAGGQVAVTPFDEELVGLVAVTNCSPAGGVAQIASEITSQLLA